MAFGAVQIRNAAVHETADGRRLMVVHGDQFDSIVKCNRLASVLGSLAYDGLIAANRWIHILRRQLGFPYWSLAAYLKQRSKNAANYIQRFEQAVLHEVRRHGLDGLVCGHIHRAQLHSEQGLSYCNTGDWVENCTALVEHHDGGLELVHWSDRQQRLKSLPGQPTADAA
jgi:UDP-2,3-diacylglucosamine pyrophosphatase LpxH